MKKTITILSVFTLFFTSAIHSQKQKDLEELYLEYFKLPRETFYLHTNKTIYLANEEIWFKTYAYDRKNALSSKITTNVYLGLYDATGTQLAKKLYLAKNGTAIGNLQLDSTLPSGQYFLKTSTNWIKNFKEDDSYIQKIQVINPKFPAGPKKISEKEYDFQFLPEGGHIVSNVKNNIGFKAIDDTGFGTISYGVILNSGNKEVASFKSSSLGIGKFSFTPLEGETYNAKVTLENGKEFEQKLPTIQQKGIVIHIDNMRSDKTIISLLTNEKSLTSLQNNAMKLVLHNEGKIKTIPISFNNTSTTVSISKKELFSGVNIATLFNQNQQPIVERMFFNDLSTQQVDMEIEILNTTKDSISYVLKNLTEINNDTLFASVSMLPSKTKSYDPSHNILSAFYLQPYIKGTIENPKYYFTNFNRKKKFELDILLLTQGWSRYSWDKVFNFQPIPKFDFENGLTLNGYLNTSLSKVTSLFLYPTKLNKSALVPYDKEGKFHIKNFYPFKDEEIKLSYLDTKGALKKPGMTLNFIKLMDNYPLNVRDIKYNENSSFYADKNDIIESFFIKSEYEKLDEIKLKAKLKKKERDNILVRAKVTTIGKDEIESFPNITDFIQHSGYDVQIGSGAFSGQVFITARRRSRAFIDVAGTAKGDFTNDTREFATEIPTPILFVDNTRQLDYDILQNLSTETVEKIIIDKSGLGMGMTAGFGGVIKVFTRKKPLQQRESKGFSESLNYVANYGFEKRKDFYVPAYVTSNDDSYQKYGVVHWEPDIVIYNNGRFILKTKKSDVENINIYLEGFTSSGLLISRVLEVKNAL